MERRLKERLIGAAVLVMIAVIFIPMILDDSSETDVTITETNILTRPDDDFNSRIVPLQESDLTPVPDASSPQTEPEPQAEIQDIPENFAIQKSPDIEVEKKSSVIDAPLKSTKNSQVGATAWVVQLGSFNSEENARVLNEKLRNAGYPAFVEPLKRQADISYRVRVGPELLRSDAQALQTRLKKDMDIGGIVIRYP
jgi:DedD protein